MKLIKTWRPYGARFSCEAWLCWHRPAIAR